MARRSTGTAHSPPLRIFLLGPFTASLYGAALSLPPSPVQALLGALLVEPRPWPRVQLAGTLFSEVPERRARQRLSHTLWLARQWLAEIPLEATPKTVRLALEAVWSDLGVFRAALATDDLAAWLEALALYRGDLLAGIYDDWLLEARESLYLRYLQLSHQACDKLWQQGRVAEMLPVAERLVQHEPLDEPALRALMRVYQALGRRGAALASYERYVALLADETGLAPDPATQSLVMTIRSSPGAARLTPVSSDADSEGVTLWNKARHALACGEATRVRECLTALRATPGCDNKRLCLLEVDLALLVEDLPRAEALLAKVDSDSPAGWVREAQVALARHDVAAARDLATDVLVAAQTQNGHDRIEVEALLVLARAAQQVGDNVYAAQSIERALKLARALAFPHGVARALLVQGQGLMYRGRYGGAGTCYREGRTVALEHGLRHDLALALRGLRIVLSHTNALSEALATVEEELAVWRDLGFTSCEAAALEGMAIIQNHLGHSAESLRTLRQAEAINAQCGDPVRVAIGRYHYACALLYHDDSRADEAVTVARRALDTFRTHHELGWESAALEILGYAQWVGKQPQAALCALREAEALTRQLGELTFVPELTAYQGLAQVDLGQPPAALALTGRAVALLAQGDVSDEVVPEILYAHAMALVACDREPEARGYLQKAYDLLLDGAAAFEEEAARQAFFHRNPTMRRLMGALRVRGMAPPANAGVQRTRVRAVRGGGSLQVAWTVDAGSADTALLRSEGAIALRRARLVRLLAESRAQGGNPTSAELAAALGVSRRTIQRDLAVLRE